MTEGKRRKIPIIKTVMRDGKQHSQTFWITVDEDELKGTGISGGFLGRFLDGADSIMQYRSVQIGRAAVTGLYESVKRKVVLKDEALTYAGLHADEVTVLQNEIGENYIIAKRITTIAATPFLIAGEFGLRALGRFAESYAASRGTNGYRVEVDIDGEWVSASVRKESTDEEVAEDLRNIVNSDEFGGPSIDTFIYDLGHGKSFDQYMRSSDDIICESRHVSVVSEFEHEAPGFGEPMVWDGTTGPWQRGVYSEDLDPDDDGNTASVSFCFVTDPVSGRRHRITPMYVSTPDHPGGDAMAANDNVVAMDSYWSMLSRATNDPEGLRDEYLRSKRS